LQRNIKIAALVLSILGLMSELVALLPSIPFSPEVIGYLRGVFTFINLDYLRIRFLEYYNFDTGLRLGYINLVAYALMVTGAILYATSNGRETRLIRFFAAIVCIEGAISVFWVIATPVFYREYIDFSSWMWMASALFGLLKSIAFTYFTYKTLRYFERIKPLATQHEGSAVPNIDNYIRASNWKRLANGAIDLFILVCIFTPFLPAFSFLAPIEEALGERTAIWLFVVISRIIYYLTFEGVFNASPAKFLTETRVVTEGERKPGFDTIAGRTFSRLIPFDAFSFFGDKGWHDSIPATKVVNEVQTGVKGSRYLLILPAILVAVLVGWAASEYYEDYKSFVYQRRKYDEKITAWKYELNHLSTSTIIEIEQPNEYSSQEIHLKVEIIDGDELTCSVLMREETYSRSLVQLERMYSMMKAIDATDVVTFKLGDLKNAYNPEYKANDSDDTYTADLLGDGKKYRIANIDRLFGPSIHDRGTGGISGQLGMDLLNYGWPAKLVKIENIEGNIEWLKEMPIDVPTVKDTDYPDFYLSGTYERGTKYKFKMTIADSLDRLHYFVVEGIDLDKTVQRVE
jgi:RDD family